jgi:hypothetical protein
VNSPTLYLKPFYQRLRPPWYLPFRNPSHLCGKMSRSSPFDWRSCGLRRVVRGHACCSTAPMQVHRFVDPITVTIAAVGHDDDENVTVTADKSLPNRLRDPQHKIASWTRLRKKTRKKRNLHVYRGLGSAHGTTITNAWRRRRSGRTLEQCVCRVRFERRKMAFRMDTYDTWFSSASKRVD